MESGNNNTLTFKTIADLTERMYLPVPLHPLVTLINYDTIKPNLKDAGNWVTLDFYKISFKNDFKGSVKYGPNRYDFKEGGLAFLAPGQSVEIPSQTADYQGFVLYFHPDILRGHPLAQHIFRFGFFDYCVTEALFLSDNEKRIITTLFEAIGTELHNPTDTYSQDILLSQIELLLNHSNRFYNRQFITRKVLHHDLIDRMNNYLLQHFSTGKALHSGLPSAHDLAVYLNVSQRYLSDMLRTLTGKTTQQYIHLLIIDQAKQMLNQKALTTAEIAYQLGFEHPQSFNKLFKQKTGLSPAMFKQRRST
ncbi:helix-turn-helix transcriptional regulator [Mucilaginibacter sp. CSA2-8R]|uniref:helix-turn-helix domain-containing protein n=1 Tax=Mucilaginibacter sp. CSA2-8R TaxID=3141542 RepID=UPI00315CC576